MLCDGADACARLHADTEGQSLSMYSAPPHNSRESCKHDKQQQLQQREIEQPERQRTQPRIPRLPILGAFPADAQPGRILFLSHAVRCEKELLHASSFA